MKDNAHSSGAAGSGVWRQYSETPEKWALLLHPDDEIRQAVALVRKSNTPEKWFAEHHPWMGEWRLCDTREEAMEWAGCRWKHLLPAGSAATEIQMTQKKHTGSTVTDTDRINWLEAHPLPTEVRGGAEDGHIGKAWAVAAHSGTLREAIDMLMLSENKDTDLEALK